MELQALRTPCGKSGVWARAEKAVAPPPGLGLEDPHRCCILTQSLPGVPSRCSHWPGGWGHPVSCKLLSLLCPAPDDSVCIMAEWNPAVLLHNGPCPFFRCLHILLLIIDRDVALSFLRVTDKDVAASFLLPVEHRVLRGCTGNHRLLTQRRVKVKEKSGQPGI